MTDEKLQKVLARAGAGSRREVETWIQAGRISVDGTRALLGQRVTGRERILIDGQPIVLRAVVRQRVLLYHKPEGEVCTRKDPEKRPTIFDHLPIVRNGRWISVGRLDLNTSGLILLTTDGELANRLMHPSQGLEREYAMRVLGPVSEEALEALRTGVILEDGSARFERLREVGGEGSNRWYHGILKEGRHREARRLWESQGVKVSRLIRIRFGSVLLPRGLRRGRWEEAPPEVVAVLAKLN
ncbi:23S rRNA pseudouridine2605 synthase [Gammaproteobacteria bacterium]